MTTNKQDEQKKPSRNYDWKLGEESSVFFILGLVFFVISLTSDNLTFVFVAIAFIGAGISMGTWSNYGKRKPPQQPQTPPQEPERAKASESSEE